MRYSALYFHSCTETQLLSYLLTVNAVLQANYFDLLSLIIDINLSYVYHV